MESLYKFKKRLNDKRVHRYQIEKQRQTNYSQIPTSHINSISNRSSLKREELGNSTRCPSCSHVINCCGNSFDWRVPNKLAKLVSSEGSSFMPTNIHRPFDIDYVKSLVRDSKYDECKFSFRADSTENLIQPPMKYCLSKYDSKLDIRSNKAMMCNTEALTEEAKSHEFRSKPNPK